MALVPQKPPLAAFLLVSPPHPSPTLSQGLLWALQSPRLPAVLGLRDRLPHPPRPPHLAVEWPVASFSLPPPPPPPMAGLRDTESQGEGDTHHPPPSITSSEAAKSTEDETLSPKNPNANTSHAGTGGRDSGLMGLGRAPKPQRRGPPGAHGGRERRRPGRKRS